MIRRPPRSTHCISSAASDVYKRQLLGASPAPATQSPGASRDRSVGDLEVAGRVRAQDSLAGLRQLIIERTEGNPFFIEELVQALFDEGAIVRNGEVKVTRSLSQLRLPPTVQGILASRIDRLPREHKELIQTLAVMGRESPLALISQVTLQSDAELEPRLSALQAGEFIYEQPAAAGVEYTFKHALTQEVAYNSLLIERRRLLHERAAITIQSLHADRLDDHLGELAHHYSCSANSRKAVHFLGRAGRQAAARSAYAEALAFLTKGLGLLKELPDDAAHALEEFDLQMALSWLSFVMMALAERQTAVLRARELAERLGDKARLTDALVALSNVMLNFAPAAAVREVAEQALDLAEHGDDAGLLAAAHMQLGAVLFYSGEFAASREHHERSSELFGPGPYRNFWEADRARWSTASLNTISLILGYPDTARKRSEDRLAAARRSSDPASIAHALQTDNLINRLLGNAPKVLERAEEELEIGTQYGMAARLMLGAWKNGFREKPASVKA